MTEPSGPAAATKMGAYADQWLPEDGALAAARARAAEVGLRTLPAGAGAALRMFAAACDARAVVQVGTGTGVSGLWLLRGMRPEGVLTSIDPDEEHQRLARLAFNEAGLPMGRVRLISGRASEVLPRLTDGAYDLVHADAASDEAQEHLTATVRLLRPGGLLVFTGALPDARTADPAARDPQRVAMRALLRQARDHADLVAALLPGNTGLLVAVHRPLTGRTAGPLTDEAG